jgi:SpoVK/Ycf46/Vps4 family AAA+-type ATPase
MARKNAPCVVFIDELDGLGMDRNADIGGNLGQYMALTVNQLLYEMDGIDQNMNRIFVIGATNRPWRVDDSLKRSGRFTDYLYVRPPSEEERKALLEFYTRRIPSSQVDLNAISSMTSGYSPADIQAVCEKAKLILIKHEADTSEERALTTADLAGIIQADCSRGAAIQNWYLAAARFLRTIKGTGEEIYYRELLAHLKEMSARHRCHQEEMVAYG